MVSTRFQKGQIPWNKKHYEIKKCKICNKIISYKSIYCSRKCQWKDNRLLNIATNNMINIRKENPHMGHYKKHSKETIEKIRKTKKEYYKNNPEIVKKYYISHWVKANGAWNKGMFGEKSLHWKGGKSFEPYTSDFNSKFKSLIKIRDNFLCLKCNMCEEESMKIFKRKLHIHHIDYDKNNTTAENCCSLCVRCNSKVNSDRPAWKNFFQRLLYERYSYSYPNLLVNLVN